MFHPTTFDAYWGVIFIVFSVFKENSCHGNHADGKNSQDTFLHTQGPKEQDCICWGKLTSTSHENPHAPALLGSFRKFFFHTMKYKRGMPKN